MEHFSPCAPREEPPLEEGEGEQLSQWVLLEALLHEEVGEAEHDRYEEGRAEGEMVGTGLAGYRVPLQSARY